MSNEVVVEQHGALVRQEDFSPDIVLKRINAIQSLMKAAMAEGVDYGVIPGTNSKPTLLKPGAEKLCVMFRLAPKYRTEKTHHADGHMTVETTCQIYDMAENFLGESSAMCSTRESKYAWRKSERVCPDCHKPAIIKGRAEFGGGWTCWKKKGGCGANFDDNSPEIINQHVGRVPNPDLADAFNTVLRIAEKRALIAAVRLVTGSSALFDEEIPNQTEHDVPEPAHVPKITGEQWRQVEAAAKASDIGTVAICNYFRVQRPSELAGVCFDEALKLAKNPPADWPRKTKPSKPNISEDIPLENPDADVPNEMNGSPGLERTPW